MNENHTTFLTILSILLFTLSCSSNPIDDDEIEIDKTSITGEVSLLDGESPERVYVWMKDYNIGTWTDRDGKFRLTIPADRRNGTGTVQKDTLHFYLANYFIIPYLLVQPENVPQAMLDKIGREVDVLDASYLKKPIRRNDGRLVWRN